jgi:hypothetical protein
MSNEKGWLSKVLQSATVEVESWPEWMRALPQAQRAEAEQQRLESEAFRLLVKHKARIGYMTFGGECQVAIYPNAPSTEGALIRYGANLPEAIAAIQSAMAEMKK